MSKQMTLKQFLIFISCSAALLFGLQSCAPQRVIENKEGRLGVVRDAIYSIEPRQNNAYVIWLRYDNEGVYCTDDFAKVNRLKQIHQEGTGWVYMTYHTLPPNDNTSVCYNVESTPTHTIYIINDFSEVKQN